MNERKVSIFGILLLLIAIIQPFFLLLIHSNLPGISLIHQTDAGVLKETVGLKQQNLATVADSVGVTPLWAQGFKGSGIRIGIIDSGITESLPEFGGRIIDKKSFVLTTYGYSNNETSTTDTYDHGTRVASLAAGATYGMAPSAELVIAKILDSSVNGNAGYPGEETSRAVITAAQWLVEEKNCTIINLSIGQYTNILRDGREYWINKLALERGVIFTISAGNEGYYGINSGSIGTPGLSLQAITVGMSSGIQAISAFSSQGPRFDTGIKPDVVAPGVNIEAMSTSGSPRSGTGTSFAAPIVAGTIASMLTALRFYNLSYTPGTIKAALIATATPIIDNVVTNKAFPWWSQGAGLINGTAALEFILAASRTNSSLPDLLISQPQQVPYQPLQTMFRGQTLGFNVTLVTSGETVAIFALENISRNFIDLPAVLLLKDTTLFPIWFTIPDNALVGEYSGNITISTNRNNLKQVIKVSFAVKEPLLRVLFASSHSGLENQIKGLTEAPTYVTDPWTSTFLWGHYREFLFRMTEFNISLSMEKGEPLTNLTELLRFDVLYLPNPLTRLVGTFTDWWNDTVYFPAAYLATDVLHFTEQELNTLIQYSKVAGKNLVITTSYPAMHNLAELNILLGTFNLTYVNELISSPVDLDGIAPNLTAQVHTIAYLGGTLRSSSAALFEGQLLKTVSSGNALFAYWKVPNGGSLVVSGSSYFLENWGLSPSFSPRFVDHLQLVLNILSIEKFNGTTFPISGVSSLSPSYSSESSSPQGSLSALTSTGDLQSYAIVVAGIGVLALLLRRKRTKRNASY